MAKAKRQKHNYVDNKKFLVEMIEYRTSVIQSNTEGETYTISYFPSDDITIHTNAIELDGRLDDYNNRGADRINNYISTHFNNYISM